MSQCRLPNIFGIDLPCEKRLYSLRNRSDLQDELYNVNEIHIRFFWHLLELGSGRCFSHCEIFLGNYSFQRANDALEIVVLTERERTTFFEAPTERG